MCVFVGLWYPLPLGVSISSWWDNTWPDDYSDIQYLTDNKNDESDSNLKRLIHQGNENFTKTSLPEQSAQKPELCLVTQVSPNFTPQNLSSLVKLMVSTLNLWEG